MLDWHKNQVEKVLKSLGLSNYQAFWISFIEGLVIGGLIAYYFI
jgi:hypothetical protein